MVVLKFVGEGLFRILLAIVAALTAAIWFYPSLLISAWLVAREIVGLVVGGLIAAITRKSQRVNARSLLDAVSFLPNSYLSIFSIVVRPLEIADTDDTSLFEGANVFSIAGKVVEAVLVTAVFWVVTLSALHNAKIANVGIVAQIQRGFVVIMQPLVSRAESAIAPYQSSELEMPSIPEPSITPIQIVLTSEANLRPSPGRDNTPIRKLSVGETVTLRSDADITEEWIPIVSSLGEEGFVSRSLLPAPESSKLE